MFKFSIVFDTLMLGFTWMFKYMSSPPSSACHISCGVISPAWMSLVSSVKFWCGCIIELIWLVLVLLQLFLLAHFFKLLLDLYRAVLYLVLDPFLDFYRIELSKLNDINSFVYLPRPHSLALPLTGPCGSVGMTWPPLARCVFILTGLGSTISIDESDDSARKNLKRLRSDLLNFSSISTLNSLSSLSTTSTLSK